MTPSAFQDERPSAPLGVVWDPDPTCNLSCRHCATPRGHHAQADWRGVHGAIMAAAPFFVSLGGGEPLLDLERTLAIVDGFGAGGIRINLTTNATLVNAAVARALAARKAFLKVTVSIEGGSARGHEAIRGVGTFQQALRGLEHLVAVGLDLSLAATVTRDTVAELPAAAVELAARWGVHHVKLARLKPVGRGMTVFRDAACTPAELQALFLRCLTCDGPDRPVRIEISDPLTALLPSGTGGGCPAGRVLAYVSPDGRCTPCPFWMHPFGRLPEDRLVTCWQRMGTFLEGLAPPPPCRDCTVVARCGGGCPGIFDGPAGIDPQCPRLAVAGP
ncbi:MAG: radical SAM protein [Magnetococcales bacterium]|nr:radical SAM protein [Magnetococcales bacterium]